MSLTRADIIDSICKQCGFSRNESIECLNFILETIMNTLESGEDVLISRFGKFCVKEKNERRGRNPVTGDELILDARRVIVFKCSPTLREKFLND